MGIITSVFWFLWLLLNLRKSHPFSELQERQTEKNYTAYGNALSSAEKILLFHSEHPELSKFNGTDYIMDASSCSDKPKSLMCYKLANKYHRTQYHLWRPNGNWGDLREPDCKYRVSSVVEGKLSIANVITLSFIIYQEDCISSIPGPLLGGTTFNIFVSNELYLQSCSYNDNYNHTYFVACTFPILHRSIKDKFMAGLTSNSYKRKAATGSHCVRLTIALEYEHFDGYGEVLLDWSHKYPPSKAFIVNGKEYCASFSSVEIASENFDNVTSKTAYNGDRLGRNSKKNSFISVYSGIWINYDIQIDEINNMRLLNFSLFNHDRRKFLSNYDYHFHDRNPMGHVPGSNLTELENNLHYVHHNLNPVSNSSEVLYEVPFLSLSSSSQSAVEYELQYSFLPTVTYIPSRAFNYKMDNSNSDKISTLPSIQIEGIFTLPKYSNYTSDTIAAQHDFHFIGMSHVRYLFDAVVEYFIGNDVLRDQGRHHDHMRFRNFLFNGTGLASKQINLLLDICREREQLSKRGESLSKLTIVIHVGPWDLSVLSLRMLLKHFGPAWVATMVSLLNRRTACPGLRHVVWITMVPYPMCHDTREVKCNNDRSYRTNSAIAATNRYFLDHILGAEISKDIILSVIDAYSFIVPRLALNEDHEKVCTNHFLCRMNANHTTLQTPGGNALLQSILYVFNRSLSLEG